MKLRGLTAIIVLDERGMVYQQTIMHCIYWGCPHLHM
jgi:hypothetical protein